MARTPCDSDILTVVNDNGESCILVSWLQTTKDVSLFLSIQVPPCCLSVNMIAYVDGTSAQTLYTKHESRETEISEEVCHKKVHKKSKMCMNQKCESTNQMIGDLMRNFIGRYITKYKSIKECKK